MGDTAVSPVFSRQIPYIFFQQNIQKKESIILYGIN